MLSLVVARQQPGRAASLRSWRLTIERSFSILPITLTLGEAIEERRSVPPPSTLWKAGCGVSFRTTQHALWPNSAQGSFSTSPKLELWAIRLKCLSNMCDSSSRSGVGGTIIPLPFFFSSSYRPLTLRSWQMASHRQLLKYSVGNMEYYDVFVAHMALLPIEKLKYLDEVHFSPSSTPPSYPCSCPCSTPFPAPF